MKTKRIGFTLAEVLITLGIIGVVAAMTMPTLITNHQKKVTATKIKQAYSILAQTAEMAKLEYGDLEFWDCFQLNACNQEQFAQKYIIPYLQGKQTQTYKALVLAGYKDYPKDLSGNTTLTGWKYFIQTSQRYMYMLDQYTLGDSSRTVYSVAIDINSASPPNIIGKDIFMTTYGYNIDKKNFYKFQMYNYSNSDRDSLIKTNCKKGEYGNCCGSVIQQDNWEIKDDYPW